MTTAFRSEDLQARLKTLIGEEQPYAWARRVGLSKGAFTGIWVLGRKPQTKTLAQIAAQTGCSFKWLSTGEGVPYPARTHQLGAVEAVAPAVVETAPIRQTHQLGAVEVVAPAVVQAPPLPGRVDWSQVSSDYRREIRELLHDVVLAVDAFIDQNDLDVPPEKHAQLIAMLFDYMLGRPNFQVEDVKAFFDLVA